MVDWSNLGMLSCIALKDMWHAMAAHLVMVFSILNGIDFGIRIDTKESVYILD